MTVDENNRIRLPRWAIEVIVLVSVAGITFSGTHFLDNATWKVNIEDRMGALESTMKAVQLEERVNSDYRILSIERLAEMEKIEIETNRLMQEHTQGHK